MPSRRFTETLLLLAFFALMPLLMGQQACLPDTVPDGGNGGTPANILALEQDAFELVNQERVANGLSPLVMDSAVRAVARAHSQDMANRKYFSHETPEGLHSWDRLINAGVSYTSMAENIAKNMGFSDPSGVAVDGWMNSEGHRANILTPGFTHTGMGVALDDEGYTIFTQVFVTP